MNGVLEGIDRADVVREDGKIVVVITEDGISCQDGYKVRMKPVIPKHKLFISCPMAGREEKDIRKSFEMMLRIAEVYTGETLQIVNPYKLRQCKNAADRIRCWSDSIKLMAEADYFIGPDEPYRERGCGICSMEYSVARDCGMKMFTVSFDEIAPDLKYNNIHKIKVVDGKAVEI